MKMYNCIDCGKRIKYKNTLRCRECYNSFHAVEQPLCIDCEKPVNKNHKPKRCQRCAGKHWFKINKIKSIRTRLIDKISNLKDKLIQLYLNKKLSFLDITLKLNISKTAVSRLIKLFKIKQRTLSESQKLKPKYGKDNPAWINGISFKPYSFKFNGSLKRKIRERDSFTCKCCGLKEENHFRALDVHHIDYNKQNCKENNLITLCVGCNVKANGNKEFDRDYWYAYYTYLIKNKL
jgi:predicted DNA-binding protein YlxM (UPF0122 family)